MKYDNLWTKLGLGNVRGNKLFKGLWRGARVFVVGGILGLINHSAFVLAGFGIPNEYIAIIAPIVEKWLREMSDKLAF